MKALGRPPISAVVLTFNSEASIRRTLVSLAQVSSEIHVVDSFSSDRTLDICEAFGCIISQRPFKNYSDQRNWAMQTLPLKFDWQLHVDADEEVSKDLAAEIAALDFSHPTHDGWMVGRRTVFLGRKLKWGGVARTWHYRLFRKNSGACEDRLYDQHFVALGSTGRLPGDLLDYQEASLSEWTLRHNRWSDMEMNEILRPASAPSGATIVGRLSQNPIERKRFIKGKYYKLPLFVRCFLYFFYRYVIRLGFLDGTEGLIYHILQGLWFRFLVDAKIFENNRNHDVKQETLAELRVGG